MSVTPLSRQNSSQFGPIAAGLVRPAHPSAPARSITVLTNQFVTVVETNDSNDPATVSIPRTLSECYEFDLGDSYVSEHTRVMAEMARALMA